MPEHHVADSQLLELLLTVRLVILLIEDDRRPESPHLTVILLNQLLIVSVLVGVHHTQLLDTLLVDHVKSSISDEVVASISLFLLVEIV